MDAIFDYKRCPADDFYAIIGCDELSTMEQILTEYRIKAVECHPDKNQGNPNTLEKFQKLQKAKDVLSDQKKRQDYDQWKRSGLAMPYDEWVARKDSIKMSMHWFMDAKKEPAIEAGPTPAANCTVDGPAPQGTFSGARGDQNPAVDLHEARVYWTSSEGSETLRKFRNYEI